MSCSVLSFSSLDMASSALYVALGHCHFTFELFIVLCHLPQCHLELREVSRFFSSFRNSAASRSRASSSCWFSFVRLSCAFRVSTTWFKAPCLFSLHLQLCELPHPQLHPNELTLGFTSASSASRSRTSAATRRFDSMSCFFSACWIG